METELEVAVHCLPSEKSPEPRGILYETIVMLYTKRPGVPLGLFNIGLRNGVLSEIWIGRDTYAAIVERWLSSELKNAGDPWNYGNGDRRNWPLAPEFGGCFRTWRSGTTVKCEGCCHVIQRKRLLGTKYFVLTFNEWTRRKKAAVVLSLSYW